MRRRLTAPPPRPGARSPNERWRQCCAGQLPAEALSQRDREDLIAELVDHGWTDTDIAAHTRLSTYTTGRIRSRLGLEPNDA